MTVVSLQNFIFQLNCLCFWQQTILKKLYAESLHVLSLSDLHYLRGLGEDRSSDAGVQLSAHQLVDSEVQLVTELHSELAAAQQSWNEEKQCLLSSVESLKKLLAQIQPDTSVSTAHC